MNPKEAWSRFRKDPKDGWYYVQGSFRMWLWQFAPALLRTHIKEQFVYRLEAARVCHLNGSCICCTCKTPDLFFAGKGCSVAKMPVCSDPRYRAPGRPMEKLGTRTEPCYPPMKSRKQWQIFKATRKI